MTKTIIRFLDMPLERIDEWIKKAEERGEKVIVSINTYKRELIIGNPDSSIKTDFQDVLTSGYSQQIRSSKDLFQYDNDDEDENDDTTTND